MATVCETVAVDVFCPLAFAKAHTSKMPISVAYLLYDRVLPLNAALGVEMAAKDADRDRKAIHLLRWVRA